jgi:aryl-alcohol dehydrogenase-like predicted oxidoreductase
LHQARCPQSLKSFADIDGRRAQHARFQQENFEHNRQLVAKIEAMAAAKGCTPAQLTLAWLLALGDDVVAIPGTRHRARLDENAGAMAVSLTAEEVTAISTAIPKGAAAGTRYPPGGMKRVFI